MFKKSYRYRGGKLTISLRLSGSANSKRFYLKAIGGAGVSGAYSQIPSVSSKPTTITKLNVAPEINFIKKSEVPWDANATARCN